MTTLRQGDRGPAVLELQTLLAMTGHDPGLLDGVFGPRTLAAWIDAQRVLRLVGQPGGMRPGAAGEGDLDEVELEGLRALPRRAVELPRILTPITATYMRIALVAGYAAAMDATWDERPRGNGDVSGQRLANAVRVALAQLAVEHGCGPWGGGLMDEALAKIHPKPWLCPKDGQNAYVYVWNFNIGNRQVRAEDMASNIGPASPAAPHTVLRQIEGSGENVRAVRAPMYAYPNAAEGAAAYWRFLRDHCGPALAAFESGDPAKAAHELKHGGWGYSGDEAAYARGMVDRFRGIE